MLVAYVLHGCEHTAYHAELRNIMLETRRASSLANDFDTFQRYLQKSGKCKVHIIFGPSTSDYLSKVGQRRYSKVFLGRVWVVVGLIVYVGPNPLSSACLWELCKGNVVIACHPRDGTRSTADAIAILHS